MMLLITFALVLFLCVLLSSMVHRSVLSVSVLFLVAGIVIGKWFPESGVPSERALFDVVQVALFSVLFTDGMNTGGLNRLRKKWWLPSRTLMFGMPLTILGIAALAHWLLGFSWLASLLTGAALSPTDPVFISSIFQFEAVPERIKHILNVESGVNDGIALPIVVILLTVLEQHRLASSYVFLEELGLGVAIGVVIPWVGIKLEQSQYFGASGIYQQLNAFALGLVVLAVSLVSRGNLFLAAFAAGVTVATLSAPAKEAYDEFGELVTELLKLAALLIFGAHVAPVILHPMSWQVYLFAALALFLVRPLAMELSLVPSHLPQREVLTIGWFGPKGFSSVVYALMILRSRSTTSAEIGRVMALAIVASIVVYSSTDFLIGRWFEKHPRQKKPQEFAA